MNKNSQKMCKLTDNLVVGVQRSGNYTITDEVKPNKTRMSQLIKSITTKAMQWRI